jgi:hypothetical protein
VAAHKSIHALFMAKRPIKRKRKVPVLKVDDMQKTTDENVGATTRSFEGTTKATQAITAEIADYTRRSFEHGAKTLEKLAGVKSPDKAFEVQAEYARGAYENYVSCSAKLGQLYVDLGKEAFKSYQDLAANLAPVK